MDKIRLIKEMIIMKELSVKDFFLGLLLTAMLFMFWNMGVDNRVGRYTVAVGGSGAGYGVCVTDTVSGATRCERSAYLGDGKWQRTTGSFAPDFSMGK